MVSATVRFSRTASAAFCCRSACRVSAAVSAVCRASAACAVSMALTPTPTATHSATTPAPTSILLRRYTFARSALRSSVISLMFSAIFFSFFRGSFADPGKYVSVWQQYSIFFPLCKAVSFIGYYWNLQRARARPRRAALRAVTGCARPPRLRLGPLRGPLPLPQKTGPSRHPAGGPVPLYVSFCGAYFPSAIFRSVTSRTAARSAVR